MSSSPIFTFVGWQREPWHLVEWPLRSSLTFFPRICAKSFFSQRRRWPTMNRNTHFLPFTKFPAKNSVGSFGSHYNVHRRWWDPGCICVSVSTYWVVDSSKHSECTFENIQFSFLFVFIHSLALVNTKRWTRPALNQHWGFVLGEKEIYMAASTLTEFWHRLPNSISLNS